MNSVDPSTNESYTGSAESRTGSDVGTAGVVEEPSPFSRVNHMRRRYFAADYTVESERAVLVTEAYRAHEAEPRIVRVARRLYQGLCRVS